MSNPHPPSERRTATVMFADVSGFTAMSRRLDPEDVTEVMNRCFAMLEAVVTAHGGTVDRYIGDCVLAVFEDAAQPGDSVRRALQAAAEMRERLRHFDTGDRTPERLQIHVGIEAGEVLARARTDGPGHAVMGETVQHADWLKDVAPRQAIWVGPGARALAGDQDGLHRVRLPGERGTDRPDDVWELSGRSDGATASAPEPSAATGSREGDRRHATVLFAEVTGLTRLANDAPAMHGLLEVVEEVVTEHGGHLDKYVGDCVMALFGAPLAIEDAPRQAVNAAIALRHAVGRFEAERPGPRFLTMHAGINTGLVLAGEVGGALRHDFTVMGDAVNVASRLKDAAPPGAIYVGPSTWTETRDAFGYRPLPPMRLKGLERPLAVHEVLSSQQQVHRVRSGGSLRVARMVGRDAELERLREALIGLGESHGGIASVVAEAGLGKSRLLAEALRLEEAQHAAVLEGRSLSMGGSLSFHPFIDMLRGWLGIADDTGEAAARERLQQTMEAYLGGRAAEALPFVARLLGIGLTAAETARLAAIEGEALERLLAKSLRELFAALAAEQPLVLVFEDLHWADGSSITLLHALLPLVHQHPVLFVLVFRPHHAQTSDRVAAELAARYGARHVPIPLGPLDDKDCARLLRQLVRYDDRPAVTRRVVLSRAEGNPFFIEEVVRSLVDVGAIERTDDGLRVTAAIETAEIPRTIQDVVLARVDRLPPHLRSLLQVGAVIGRSFPTRLIETVAGEDDAVALGLRQLAGRQLLETGRSGGEAGYAFAHALAQETVYASILRRTRRELHRRVADAVESLFADRLPDWYGMLAYHYGRAHDLEKAGEYLMKAGDEAVRTAASHEAVHYFSEAARLYVEVHGEGRDRTLEATLEKKIGLAYLNKGDLPNALEHFDRSLACLDVHPPRTPLQITRRLALDLAAIVYHAYLRTGRARRTPSHRVREMAEICFHKGKAQSTSAPQGYVLSMLPAIRVIGAYDPSSIAHACGVYSAGATLFAWSGLSFALAGRLMRRARTLIRTVPDDVVYHSMTFVARYLEGDWSDEHVLDPALVEEGLRYGMFWEVNTYLGFDCERLIHQGRFAEALERLRRIADLGDVYAYDFARTNEYAMRAFMLLEARRLAEALPALDRYHAICTEDALNVLALGTRSKILLLGGDRTGALAALEEGEEIARRLGRQAAPYHLAPLLTGRFLADLDDVERASAAGRVPPALARQARASGRRALGLAARNATERCEALRLMARFDWMLGRRRQARRTWRRGLRTATALGARPELARLLIESGERLATADDGGRLLGDVDADALLERGRTVRARLEATWADSLDGEAGVRRSA